MKYSNSSQSNSNIDDMLENKSFIHYSCGIDADPADGFGYCTCGVVEELAEIKKAIQQELLKARIDELEHIEDKHKVRLWFDGFYGVDDRITNLQAKLKGDE